MVYIPNLIGVITPFLIFCLLINPGVVEFLFGSLNPVCITPSFAIEIEEFKNLSAVIELLAKSTPVIGPLWKKTQKC